MDYAVTTLGFTGADSGISEPISEHDEIEDGDLYQIVFEDLVRLPGVGDDDVNCSNLGAVRQAEAANQIGPRLPQVSIGQAVRIHYGNGESELFVIQCKICSIPAAPIPGTCG